MKGWLIQIVTQTLNKYMNKPQLFISNSTIGFADSVFK